MAKRLPTGIFATATGYRVFQRVVDRTRDRGTRLCSKRFHRTPDYEPTIKEMRQWQAAQRVAARQTPAPLPPVLSATGFPADVLTYLTTVRAMPSYADRVRDLKTWLTVFGDIPRSEITAAQIRAARDQWLTVGPKRVLERRPGAKAAWAFNPIPLSASTVNHRLRALENLFTVLDGKHAQNPVREVDEATEPSPQPRGQSFALALEILKYMPDVTTPKKNGAVEKGSLSRVRFAAMLWTGLPAVQLARLTPELVDWTVPAIRVPRRQKGRQSRRARGRPRDRPRPLLPQAVTALKRFFALGANRQFSSTSLARSVRRAIRAANRVRKEQRLALIPETLTVYELCRHTFATEAYRASGDLKAVQELLGHADISQTERYALAAVNERTVLAIAQLARHARRPGNFLATFRPQKSTGRVRTRRARSA